MFPDVSSHEMLFSSQNIFILYKGDYPVTFWHPLMLSSKIHFIVIALFNAFLIARTSQNTHLPSLPHHNCMQHKCASLCLYLFERTMYNLFQKFCSIGASMKVLYIQESSIKKMDKSMHN